MQTKPKLDQNKLNAHKALVDKMYRTKEVRLWVAYEALSAQEKTVLAKKWDNYYKACDDSMEAELYRVCREALKKSDMEKVKELGSQARLMLVNGIADIAQPSDLDPYFLGRCDEVSQYQISKRVIEDATLSGVSDLF